MPTLVTILRWFLAVSLLGIANIGGLVALIMDGPGSMSPMEEILYELTIIAWFLLGGLFVAMLLPRYWLLGVFAGAVGLMLSPHLVGVGRSGAAIYEIVRTIGAAGVGAVLGSRLHRYER